MSKALVMNRNIAHWRNSEDDVIIEGKEKKKDPGNKTNLVYIVRRECL